MDAYLPAVWHSLSLRNRPEQVRGAHGRAATIKIQRMKKIKLSMRDKIAFIENQITPDIIA